MLTFNSERHWGPSGLQSHHKFATHSSEGHVLGSFWTPVSSWYATLRLLQRTLSHYTIRSFSPFNIYEIMSANANNRRRCAWLQDCSFGVRRLINKLGYFSYPYFAWRRSVVVSALASINWTRLVLGWVTACGRVNYLGI